MECSICGAPPSGLHYGATTCEACKAFFKRTVHSCLTYSCIRPGNPGQCPVRGNRRRQCAFCRWRRCLTVGMRPELIRSAGAGASPSAAAGSSASCSTSATETEEMPQPQAQAQAQQQQQLLATALLKPLAEPQIDYQHGDSPVMQRLMRLDSPLIQLEPSANDNATEPVLSPEEITAGVSQANESLVQLLVSFAKGLPEFCSLPLSDKKCLLQHHWLALNVWEIANNSVPYNGYIRFSSDFRLHESNSSQHSRSFSNRAGRQMRTFIRRLTALQITRLEFLLLKAVFLLDADSETNWSDRAAIDLAQGTYLAELTKVCGDATRKSTLLLLFGTLSAMKIHSVGFWASVIERTKYLPQPLLSEMLDLSLSSPQPV